MRFTRLVAAASLIALPISCLADEFMTFDLPPSRSVSAQTTPPTSPPGRTTPGGEAAEFARYNAANGARTQRRTSTLSSRHSTTARTREQVVGKLGMATSTLTIRARPGSTARSLARVDPGTYLALTGDAGAYYGVLMSDHSTGYVPRSRIRLLEYEVVAAGGLQPPGSRYGSGAGAQLLRGSQNAILQMAYTYLGVPYKWGGTRTSGIDCSAFVQKCFAGVGVRLPRTSREQFLVGMRVSTDELQPADRLYFGNGTRVTHTGMYIGNGYFIHSSSSRGGVAINRLTDSNYQRIYMGARR